MSVYECMKSKNAELLQSLFLKCALSRTCISICIITNTVEKQKNGLKGKQVDHAPALKHTAKNKNRQETLSDWLLDNFSAFSQRDKNNW
jgi:hypothetical protein